MAKDKERNLAHHFYVKEGKTAKECAKLVNVTEKTVGGWVDKYDWKKQRHAQVFSKDSKINNVKEIIGNIAEDYLKLQKQLNQATADKDGELVESIRSQMATKSDEAAKWNKHLQTIDKENKIGLATYLYVMEDIFKALRQKQPQIFMQLIEFQEQHLHDIANKL
jgi:rRNA processing protein Gar1